MRYIFLSSCFQFGKKLICYLCGNLFFSKTLESLFCYGKFVVICGMFYGLLCLFLQLSVEAKYPSNWNDHQTWKCILTACRVSGYLVFQHKEFFQGSFNVKLV